MQVIFVCGAHFTHLLPFAGIVTDFIVDIPREASLLPNSFTFSPSENVSYVKSGVPQPHLLSSILPMIAERTRLVVMRNSIHLTLEPI